MNRVRRPRAALPGIVAALAAVLIWGLPNGKALAAGLPSPPEDPWRELPIPTSKVPPATALQLGGYELQLEHVSLNEILKKMLPANRASAVSHTETAYESSTWTCFDLANGQRLWLVAEVGTSEVKLAFNRVAAEQLDARTRTASCPPLAPEFSPVSLDQDVWLGATTGELTALFGEPSARRGDWLSFYYTRRFVRRRQVADANGQMVDDFDVSSYLDVRIDGGRVSQLVAGQLTGE